MTDEEFEQLILTIKAAYPNANVLPDAYSLKVWYRMLEDLDFKMAENVIAEHMSKSPFPPSISEIRGKCVSRQIDIPDWGDAWGKVQAAIQRYGSYREAEAMSCFDDTTRAVVKRIGFRNLCMAKQDNLETDRAQFRDIYKAIAQRRAEERQIPPLVLEEREKIRRKYIGDPKPEPPRLIDYSAEREEALRHRADPIHVERLLSEFRDLNKKG